MPWILFLDFVWGRWLKYPNSVISLSPVMGGKGNSQWVPPFSIGGRIAGAEDDDRVSVAASSMENPLIIAVETFN